MAMLIAGALIIIMIKSIISIWKHSAKEIQLRYKQMPWLAEPPSINENMNIFLAIHGFKGNNLIYITSTPLARDVVATPTCDSISLYCEKCMPIINLNWSGEFTAIVNGIMKHSHFQLI